ncbi:hypothetical protein [Roseomonas fluvialis]|uniref:hypothetical protein n=1 Tax=Roseomonas fluvialis TaxID=1750527 RepID=UPI001FCAD585|nr:hypothetical protein [Roseomonas fluvialis]
MINSRAHALPPFDRVGWHVGHHAALPGTIVLQPLRCGANCRRMDVLDDIRLFIHETDSQSDFYAITTASSCTGLITGIAALDTPPRRTH